MNVLALDPSSKAIGWALAGAAPQSGVYKPLNWRAAAMDADLRHMHLCGRASWWLSDMLTEHGPEVLVIECGGGRMSDRCSERLRGALFAVAWSREIATTCVHPRTWQAWCAKCRPKFAKSDEADACGILEWFLATQVHRVVAA